MGRAAWMVAGLVGVAGFVLGYAAASVGGAGDPGSPPSGPPDANAVGTAREPPERAARTPVPAAPAPAPLEPPPLAPADEAMSGKALAEPAAPPPAASGGTIRGSVRTKEGQGVGDVEIEAWAVEPEGLREAASGLSPQVGSELPIEERVRAFVRLERRREGTRRTARSQPDGSFTLTDLADTTYRLEAWSKRYQLRPTISEDGRRARPGTIVEFRASPKFSIPIRVVGPDGKDMESAQIRLDASRGFDGAGVEWRRSRGILEVTWRPGSREVVAVAGDYAELTSDPVEVELRHDADVSPIVLHVRGRPGVCGRLVFGPAWGWADNGCVRLLRFRGAETPTDAELAEDGQRSGTHAHDGYRFAFRDLAPGRYRLGAWSRDVGTIDAAWTLEVADRMVVRDFEVPDPLRSRHVEVRAHDPNGRPLADVHYALDVRGPQRSDRRGALALRRGVGVDWLRWDDFTGDRDADTKWFVVARHERFASTEAEFTPAPEATATVRFGVPAFVVAAVAGYAESPHAGMLAVTLKEADAPPPESVNLPHPIPPPSTPGDAGGSVPSPPASTTSSSTGSPGDPRSGRSRASA